MLDKKTKKLIQETSSAFGTRKVSNRAEDYSFDEHFMEKLKVEGLTSEMLAALENKVPIFKYPTQITIHGIFPESQMKKIYGYRNCTINKNKTLGLKYNTIDIKKKKKLGEILKFIFSKERTEFPMLEHGSNSLKFKLSNYSLRLVEEVYHRIDTSLFYGHKHIDEISHPAYRTSYALVVDLGIIKEENIWSIVTNWTGVTKDRYDELMQLEEDFKKT